MWLRELAREAFARQASRFRDHVYTQEPAYALAMARLRSARCELLAWGEAEEPLGLAAVRVRRSALPGVGLALVSGGPLLVGPAGLDAASAAAGLAALVDRYVVDRRLPLLVQPPVFQALEGLLDAAGYDRAGLAPAPGLRGDYRTLAVRIDRGDEALRASFHPRWRNHLRSAERRGLRVERGGGPALFERFDRLFGEMAERKGIAPELAPAFFAEVSRSAEPGAYEVWLASDAEGDLGGILVALQGGSAVYLLGATGRRGLATKAAYLLQWEAMRACRERGASWYDLGGTDPVGNPGVHHFKSRTNGVPVAVSPRAREPAGVAGLAGRLARALYGLARRRGAPRSAGG
jgi:hypothetical protein